MSKPSILRTDVSPRRALTPLAPKLPASLPAVPARRLAASTAALLKVLPAVSRALQIGGDDGGALAEAYRRSHPGCDWRHVPDGRALPDGLGNLDLIVLCEGWQRTDDPHALLVSLATLGGPNCQLFVEMENQARLARVQQWIEGDLTEPDAGALTQRHLHHASPASLTKLLLDSGWLPALAATTPVADPDARVLAAALMLAESTGTPAATAQRTLCTERFVMQAVRAFASEAPSIDPMPGSARFTVVVPTNRDNQLRLNVEQSPGLREVGARIVARRGAADPAAALAGALPEVDADWVLLCHQDIYFPAGFGHRLQAVLAGIAPADRSRTLIGFAGIGVDTERGVYENAGFVIDRGHRFDHPASKMAVSIDELAIVVARDSVHRVDPQMGWHLWATELCLAAVCTHKVFPQIVRLPLFHNSVNDYRLPESFHASARRLTAKYPDFGPIHTLCGVLPNVPPAPAQATAVISADGRGAELPAADDAIAFALQADDPNQALQLIVAGVHRHYRLPEATNRLLYYPGMDRRVEQLARRLDDEHPLPAPNAGAPRGQLLIATELYALGGHTRVLADVAAELDRPTIVLTDLFRALEQDAAPLVALKALFPHADVRVLPPGSHWEKCQALRRLAAELNPRDIVHFGHHQDPIPFVATLHADAPNQLFIHHGDHNPGLGCTLPRLRHVDLSDGVREICAAHLQTPVATLPMHVDDRGPKSFAAPSSGTASVVTSGHADKFARGGPLALQQIVLTALRTLGGRHIHIGPLPDDWRTEIRAALAAAGIDPARFVTVGWVPSLWDRLKSLDDAALCIGSAPLGGGRAAVEAQGCGYPVLYYADPAEHALSTNHPMYAERALAWATTDELAARLRDGVDRHAAHSAAARALYESAFAREPFRRALRALIPA